MIVTTMDGVAGRITGETLGARLLGADAIVGLRLDVIEMNNGVFCVNATGTAVKTVKLPQPVPVFGNSPSTDTDADFGFGFLAARPSYIGSTLRH